jgi:hypothetical protein
MDGVAEYQLADVLALVRALLDNLAIVLEKMIDEEFVEFFLRTLGILIDLSC